MTWYGNLQVLAMWSLKQDLASVTFKIFQELASNFFLQDHQDVFSKIHQDLAG
jgi:hypothetical protein